MEDEPTRAFEEIKRCVLGWEKTFQDPVENTNWHNHYTEQTDNWMEKMSPVNLTLRSKYDCQTNLVAILRAAVERNIIYKELGVPERRKNGWTLPLGEQNGRKWGDHCPFPPVPLVPLHP